ncbi:MAG TPA: pitrilysin family protein [Candidatus Eisenbacteria bacterium]|nr:pitrilysin family protein [Candidatus Eisenbacteria bacterium]
MSALSFARRSLRAGLVALLLAPAIAGVPASARAQGGADIWNPYKLQTPSLHAIPQLHPQHFVLPNGVSVYLFEDHSLPVVKGTLYDVSSPLFVPDDKMGLGTIAGEAMRSGGSSRHSGDWLDDHLAAIGASISTSIGGDMANAGFRCLTENTNDVVGLFAEVLREPAFPADKIELSKVGLRQAIASRNDEMIPLLVRVARKAVWGKGHPYARDPEYATVEAVTREDCVQLWRRVFEPSRAKLAVYGDFDAARMKALLTQALGGWSGTKTPLPALPPLPHDQHARLVFAPKDDVTQSGIILAQIGYRTDDPDAPSMEVFAMGLGGGFQSRLINRIRTERGLAYATGAVAGDGLTHPGVFLTYSLTKSESTMTALDLLREETKKAVEAPFSDQELSTAKQSVQNLFVFNFEDPSEVLNRMAMYEAIGYPQDFLARYQAGLAGVSAQSVLAAAQHKVHPDDLVAIVVGKEKDFDKPLTGAGLPLERVDIAIPPPPSKVQVGEATPEAKQQADAWLAKAVAKAGGSKAWRQVKAVEVEQKSTVSIQGQQLEMQGAMTWEFPDRRLDVQKLPMGEMRQGLDGAAGWRSMMGQIADQPELAARTKAEYERSLFHVFAHPDELTLQAMAPQTVDGVKYDVAFVKSDDVKDWMLWFAPDGTLARMQFSAQGPAGPEQQTVIYADWKPEGAIVYPHHVKLEANGATRMDSQVTKVAVNPSLTAEMFKKPAK